MLIAALGGEGGGVLTQWIVSAATRCGLPAQSTSIPGVAQRTGATTYYVEIWSERTTEARRPVLALNPGIGDVDLLVASELLEAGRTVGAGFVTEDRTRVIASTSRAYIVTEKMAMGDGRYDPERLRTAVLHHARDAVLFDMEAVAQKCGAMINAVMLGAIAARGDLPLTADAFEAAMCEDGKAIESNLRGFRAGFEAATVPHDDTRASARPRESGDPAPVDSCLHGNEREGAVHADDALAAMPHAARDIVAEGVRRLAAYQDSTYARLYLDRLRAIAEADRRCGASGALLRETGRHLALRMSYEDVIRVAQAKIDPARLARIERARQLPPGATLRVSEFLKPGVEELCSVLPPRLARRILAAAERHRGVGQWHWGMQVDTTSISGFLRFWMLAKLRRWRPRSFRYQEEQAAIEAWLSLVAAAASVSPELALEVAACARLIKGYGDTHKRGTANFDRIVAEVIRPALAGQLPVRLAADAVASAREAALRDPKGEALSRCLSDLAALPMAAE